MENEDYMRLALAMAADALAEDEVPVGCVIIRKGEIVGKGRNRREKQKNALAHAEIEAINEACLRLGGWRLPECSMFVTLEPCPMCAGAILNARIEKVFFGAYDTKAGAMGSVLNIFEHKFNHIPDIQGGILREECSKMLSEFFKNLREAKRTAVIDLQTIENMIN